MRLNDRFRYFHVLIILKDNSLGEILRSGPHQLIYILINTYFTLRLMKTKLLIAHRYLTSFHRLQLTLALHLLLSIVMIWPIFVGIWMWRFYELYFYVDIAFVWIVRNNFELFFEHIYCIQRPIIQFWNLFLFYSTFTFFVWFQI